MKEIVFEPARDRRLPGDLEPRCPQCRGGVRRAVVRPTNKVVWKCDIHGWVKPTWDDPEREAE